jgi:alpha-ribazole phosphatase/probable phosphoglycerate mutase
MAKITLNSLDQVDPNRPAAGGDPFTTVFLLRHGETVNTADGELRYNGITDVGVTGRARAQMRRHAAAFARLQPRIAAVYSSDLSRCRLAAAEIASACGRELELEPQLREFNMGDWEGLSLAEVESRYPEQVKRKFADFFNYRIPGSETVGEVEARVYPAFDRLVQRHYGESIAIVAHGGVNLLLLCRALGLGRERIFSLSQDFGCINRLHIGPNFSRVVMLNSAGLFLDDDDDDG